MAIPAKDLIVPAISAGAAILTNAWQARRADTAHQREVRDLKKAGLNPALSAMGGRGAEVGALTDPGEKAVSSALAVQRMKAEIGLIEDQALLTRTQAGDIQQGWQAGKWDVMRAQLEGQRLSNEERRRLLDMVVPQARAEIESRLSGARAARASAALDEAARTGALNEEEFQRMIGEAGPALRFLIFLLRGVRR